MQEPSGEPLGPQIKTRIKVNIPLVNKDVVLPLLRKKVHPYEELKKELKEKLGPQKYEAVVVFGEGPIKRVFFSDEWDKIRKLYKPDQIERWEKSQKTKPPSGLSHDQLINWAETQGLAFKEHLGLNFEEYENLDFQIATDKMTSLKNAFNVILPNKLRTTLIQIN